MHFSTAGIDVAPWVPPLAAFVVSFFTSMGGVSGAFLLLPFQVSVLGYSTPSVSATNQLFNVIAIPGGVYRYAREGRMVWPLVWIIVLGTLPGVLIGAVIRASYLPDPVRFKLFAAGVLLYIGVRMVRGLLASRRRSGDTDAEEGFQNSVRDHKKRGEGSGGSLPVTRIKSLSLSRISYEFYGETFDVSVWGVLVLSLIVGVVGGVYGIGGGAIIAPFLVSVFGLPVYTVAGAALMGTFVTSVAGVAFYQLIAPLYPTLSVAPDWGLGALFGLGGMLGIYLGARCQKYVPARLIKWMLAAIIVLTAVKYIWEFVS
jgi:uncharacterized membrane protein YfcA